MELTRKSKHGLQRIHSAFGREGRHLTLVPLQCLGVATPAEPRGEKKTFFFVQILGGEKLLKFVEKCR